MDFLDSTRASYDAAAVEFASMFESHLDGKPVERAALTVFANLVAGTGNRTVIDVGCGSGVTTRILSDLGVSVTGIDLSPGMVSQARSRHPDLEFREGSMGSLDLPDGCAGGVCAWYSTIHVPDPQLRDVFDEFNRVLAPGGVALLAFQVGDHPLHLTEAYGVPIDLVFHRRTPSAVAASLSAAGLPVYVQTVRQADTGESTPQAFLLARKPAAADVRL